MENFDKGSISSQLMQLVYRYDKPLRDVLSDFNSLDEDPDIVDPLVDLDNYYKEKQNEQILHL